MAGFKRQVVSLCGTLCPVKGSIGSKRNRWNVWLKREGELSLLVEILCLQMEDCVQKGFTLAVFSNTKKRLQNWKKGFNYLMIVSKNKRHGNCFLIRFWVRRTQKKVVHGNCFFDSILGQADQRKRRCNSWQVADLIFFW